jgi:hypothetical protein
MTELLCVRSVGVFFLRHSVHLYSTVVTPYTLCTVEVGRSITGSISWLSITAWCSNLYSECLIIH